MRSNLTVTVAAANRMLCERARVKTALNITTSTHDTRIDQQILAASRRIAELLGREPWLQTYVENLPGQGGRYLRLSCWPLLGSPASVTFGTGSSPSTISASTYSVAGPWRDRLYSAAGWSLSSVDTPTFLPEDGDRPLDYGVTYTAGWVVPSLVSAWGDLAVVSAGDWYESSDPASPFIFRVTTGGTTGASEPTWPTAEGGTVTDGDAVFTAYAQRLPEDLEEAAIMLAADWFRGGLAQPAGVKRESYEGASIEYRDGAGGAVSNAVLAIVGGYG